MVAGSTRLSQQDATMAAGVCPSDASFSYWSWFGAISRRHTRQGRPVPR